MADVVYRDTIWRKLVQKIVVKQPNAPVHERHVACGLPPQVKEAKR
jgi:hypothetical protein